MKIGSVLLAGGQNKRMNGFPKWDLQFGHHTILVNSLLKLREISKQVMIVSGGDYTFHLPEFTEIKIVYDNTPYLGPLNGIHSALANSDCLYHFIVAADMPFFSVELAKYMFELAQRKKVDMVIPVWKGKLQPLHGIYSKNLLPSIKKDLSQKKFSLVKWIMDQKSVFILEDIEQFNSNGQVFFNMNNPEDYQKALVLLAKGDKSE